MKVRITKPAERQLDRIDEYYKKKGNQRKGKKLREKIVKQSKLLSQYPEMGQEEIKLKHLKKGHRYIFIKPFYKLIYRIVKPIIFITDFFDTRQDPNKMKP